MISIAIATLAVMRAMVMTNSKKPRPIRDEPMFSTCSVVVADMKKPMNVLGETGRLNCGVMCFEKLAFFGGKNKRKADEETVRKPTASGVMVPLNSDRSMRRWWRRRSSG